MPAALSSAMTGAISATFWLARAVRASDTARWGRRCDTAGLGTPSGQSNSPVARSCGTLAYNSTLGSMPAFRSFATPRLPSMTAPLRKRTRCEAMARDAGFGTSYAFNFLICQFGAPGSLRRHRPQLVFLAPELGPSGPDLSPSPPSQEVGTILFMATALSCCMSEARRYTLVVRAQRSGSRPKPWGWEIWRDGGPLPVRVREVAFRTEHTARLAGKVAFRDFLSGLAEEQAEPE
jgi:hypothetical protein